MTGRPGWHGWRGGADEGSAALELVVLAPVLLVLIALVIGAGRTSIAQSSVDAAARDAARQASLKFALLRRRQAVMARTFGISPAQSR